MLLKYFAVLLNKALYCTATQRFSCRKIYHVRLVKHDVLGNSTYS